MSTVFLFSTLHIEEKKGSKRSILVLQIRQTINIVKSENYLSA